MAAPGGLELNLPDLPEVPIRLGQESLETPSPWPRGRRPDWRVRIRDALTAYLPLLLMVLLALGTWWLVKNSPLPQAPTAARPTTGEPDYTLRGFGVQRFGADGRLEVTLEGRLLHHYPDSDRIQIEEVRLVSNSPDAPPTTASARSARSNGKGTDVELLGGAQLRSRTSDGQALEMDSEYLRLQTSLQRVSTDRPVVLRVGAQTIRAGGLVWNESTKSLELKPPIRAVLQPGARGKTPP
jgi:lipopolysaccharide export system protein LptC